jgi:hypothetical protein
MAKRNRRPRAKRTCHNMFQRSIATCHIMTRKRKREKERERERETFASARGIILKRILSAARGSLDSSSSQNLESVKWGLKKLTALLLLFFFLLPRRKCTATTCNPRTDPQSHRLFLPAYFSRKAMNLRCYLRPHGFAH